MRGSPSCCGFFEDATAPLKNTPGAPPYSPGIRRRRVFHHYWWAVGPWDTPLKNTPGAPPYSPGIRRWACFSSLLVGRRPSEGLTGLPSVLPGRAPSESPTASASHSPSECTRVAPPAAGRSCSAAIPESLPETPPRLGLTPRSIRSRRHPPRCSLVSAHPFPCRLQHIPPKDPVVQHIKPELRFLLGLLAQLLSQLRNFLRQSWLLHRFRHRLSCACPSLRIGIFVQAGFSSSYRIMFLQNHVFSKAPSLHGRYPASSLLWASPTPGQGRFRLCLPLHVDCFLFQSPCRVFAGAKARSSSAHLSTRAAPNHPGRSDDCSRLLLHRR